MRVLLILIPVLLVGCQSLVNSVEIGTHINNRDPIGTFATTYLDSEELVDCLNMNPPTFRRNNIFLDSNNQNVWLSPVKHPSGLTVIYSMRYPDLIALIHENQNVELYTNVRVDDAYYKKLREHYQSVC